MKKRIVVFTVFIGLCYAILSAFSNGAGINSRNCTGAKGSVTNCAGTSCHGTGPGTTAYIRVDGPGGIITGSYTPGMTYTVTVGGVNTLSLPKYGFQFTAVKGTGSSQTQAGTYSAYPLYVTGNYFSSLLFVEQTQGIDAPTPGIYRKSFQWVAPSVAGFGTITMYLTLLAVNGNNFADTLDVSNNVSVTLLENVGPSAVQDINKVLQLTAWPNPVNNTLHLSMDNPDAGRYTLTVYDLSGRLVASETAELSSAPGMHDINTSAWQPGMYKVVAEKDGLRKMITVIRQ